MNLSRNIKSSTLPHSINLFLLSKCPSSQRRPSLNTCTYSHIINDNFWQNRNNTLFDMFGFTERLLSVSGMLLSNLIALRMSIDFLKLLMASLNRSRLKLTDPRLLSCLQSQRVSHLMYFFSTIFRLSSYYFSASK